MNRESSLKWQGMLGVFGRSGRRVLWTGFLEGTAGLGSVPANVHPLGWAPVPTILRLPPPCDAPFQ